jgi:hypothetical protein
LDALIFIKAVLVDYSIFIPVVFQTDRIIIRKIIMKFISQ